MKTRTMAIQAGQFAAALNGRAQPGSNNAQLRFFQLMAATARTEEARTVYLAFMEKERKLLAKHQCSGAAN